jgi:hypothetical protein
MFSKTKKGIVRTKDLKAALRSQVGFTPTGEVRFFKPESKLRLFIKRFSGKQNVVN